MDNPETLAKSSTQETGRRRAKHKNTIQHRKQSRMDNPETLAKSGVSWLSILECFLCCIVFLCFAGLRPVSCVPDFASVWVVKWTTKRHWQNQAHKTQDKQNTKTQYNTENNQEWKTKRHWQN
jgi:hypothetical protein